ncbi:acyl-CoA synthetase [Halomarina ordinaria]|uniref:Long-chain fatty acid--CoA ligase n=1 Tax=Halomarina ordinaria TaxID=3033939 RepID=A0ABD5UD80_9EURY|nr:long-chain fatty acid--CoA ligase [Halomarina sp. PSRA2]
MRQANFGYILRKKSYYHPDSVAIVEQTTRDEHTYGKLERRSNSIARALADRGIGQGDRVCGLFRNSIEFFELFFATCKLGAVIAPFNYRLSPDELDYLTGDVEPDLYVFESVFEETVKHLSLDGVQTVRIGSPSEERVDADPWDGFYEFDSAELSIADGFDDPAVLLYTSGSTGRPKGVPLSHKNLFFSSVSYVVDAQLSADDVTVTSSPIFHVGGLNIFTLPLLHVGGTVVLQQEFDPEEAWEILEAYDVTKTFAIPTMLNAMVDVEGWREHDLSALELVVGGGEPVPSELKRQFDSIDVQCVAAYGLTETTDGSLMLRPEHAMEKPPKCNGQTFTHVDAKVVDESGAECGPGESGELLHRGPTVADGYLGLPEKTAEVWDDDGWFHTGDIAEVDEDGFYHIHGRLDDMIISGGENIYPSEVEEALYSHPDVTGAVVFGVPDSEWGEVVTAVVATTDGKEISEEALRSFLESRLARFKHPKRVEFVEDLPTSGTGKIERQAVVERHT